MFKKYFNYFLVNVLSYFCFNYYFTFVSSVEMEANNQKYSR